MLDISGFWDHANLAELTRPLTESSVSASSDTLEISMETVYCPTSPPTATITKDTIPPSRLVSVPKELSSLEEPARPSPPVPTMPTSMACSVSVTPASSCRAALV